jgi:hypothetical protein
LRTSAVVAFLAFGAGACTTSTPTQSTTSTIVVHAVLNPADVDQIVAVQRTTAGMPHAAPVDSAIVTITGPDGVTMTGVEVSDSLLTRVYRVRMSNYGETIAAGGTYRLRVRLRTGEEVTGSTTVPAGVIALPPAPSGDVLSPSRDTLRLSWPRVPGARSYEVRVQSASAVYAMFADTSAVLPANMRSFTGTPVFTSLTHNVVVVSAVDEAYYQYYRTNSDEFTGATVQGNLSGAEGVFGSVVVVKTVTVWVAAATR